MNLSNNGCSSQLPELCTTILGMGYQPWLKKDAESTLIKFNRSDNSTYAKYTEQLKSFLSGEQTFVACRSLVFLCS